jgi:hypothetical protein
MIYISEAKTLARQINPKREFQEYREYLRTSTPDYLCFCFSGSCLQFCNDNPQRCECVHKQHEVTPLFDSWLDGKINKVELIKALLKKELCK